jgi:hypothetical protein
VVDLEGDGFLFTDVTSGVLFDLLGTGQPVRSAWTSDGRDPFLVLDRNGNGRIDNGFELFGNLSAQPAVAPGQMRNGFLALAVFDRVSAGGNGDGVLSTADSVFGALRFWFDWNHDGISQANELVPLVSAGVSQIELDFKESSRHDPSGNRLRFRSEIRLNPSGQPGSLTRRAVDVFFNFAR